MTIHRDLYAGLKNEAQLSRMLLVEKNLSRKSFFIVGKDKVARQQAGIQQGDIIAFTTDQEGLDIAHVGFAARQGRHLHLLHASSKEGAVVISKETLGAYLKSNKTFTGIIVARFHNTLR
jgi:cell wall-associated NlpC family hydrolase